jgi:stringent starvation protein B
MADSSPTTSTRPYLVRAIYEWCTDNGYTPYIVVSVNADVRVPMEFVKNGEMVLNVSFDATSGLQLGNEFIEFKGRFGGVARDIFVPVGRVSAIYARENDPQCRALIAPIRPPVPGWAPHPPPWCA